MNAHQRRIERRKFQRLADRLPAVAEAFDRFAFYAGRAGYSWEKTRLCLDRLEALERTYKSGLTDPDQPPGERAKITL
jgi:hypothetical protein